MPPSFCLSTEERLPGWEDRFAAVIVEARSKAYRLGEHDCFRVACSVVEALVGVDLWQQWAGKYKTDIKALRLIAQFGKDFTSAASKLFGSEPRPVAFARRGDICEYVDERGKQHLGILIGAEVAVLGETGLLSISRGRCQHCWRIG
jgi:hypothetical protein